MNRTRSDVADEQFADEQIPPLVEGVRCYRWPKPEGPRLDGSPLAPVSDLCLTGARSTTFSPVIDQCFNLGIGDMSTTWLGGTVDPPFRPRSHPARDEVRGRAREKGTFLGAEVISEAIASALKEMALKEMARVMTGDISSWTFGTIEAVYASATERESPRTPDYAALRDKSSIMESLARQLDERLESYQVDAKARAQKPDPYTEHRLREADLMQVAAAAVDAADETAPFAHFNDPAWLAARERAFAARRAEVAAYRQAAQIADPYEAHRIRETATLERRTVEGETGFFVGYWDWNAKDPGTWRWAPPRTAPKTTRRG